MRYLRYKYIAINLIFILIASPVLGAIEESLSVRIPKQYGRVTGQWSSPQHAKDRLVIHIKDMHCHYGTQKNISGILASLFHNSQLDIIGIEGADGPVETEVFAIFPDVSVKEKMSDEFIKKGLLTGSERFSICNDMPHDISLWGVEDAPQYIENLTAFRTALNSMPDCDPFFDALTHRVDRIKKDTYPAYLYDFEKNALLYRDATLALDAWIKTLTQYSEYLGIAHNDFANISLLRRIIELDIRCDETSLHSERMHCAQALKSIMPPEKYTMLFSWLQYASLTADADEEIFALFRQYAPAGQYPAINTFFELLSAQKKLDHEALLEEVEMLSDEISKALVRVYSVDHPALYDVHNQLSRIERMLYLYRKAIQLALTSLEYEEFTEFGHADGLYLILRQLEALHNTTYPSEKTISLRTELPDNLIPALERAEHFYIGAHNRSITMVDNLLAQMNARSLEQGVLISGGFHSDKIEQQLKSRGISYVTITPYSGVALKGEDSNQYLSLMRNPDIQADLYPSAARYVAFPVINNQAVANSPFFVQARRQMARYMLSDNVDTLPLLKQELDGDVSHHLFTQLLVLAGIRESEMQDITLTDVIARISPRSFVDYLTTFTDERIDELLRASDVPDTELTPLKRFQYAQFILSLLHMSTELAASEDSPVDLLVLLLSETHEAQYSALSGASYHLLARQLEQDDASRTTIAVKDCLQHLLSDRILKNRISQALNAMMPDEHIIVDNLIIIDRSSPTDTSQLWCECIYVESDTVRRFYIVGEPFGTMNDAFIDAERIVHDPSIAQTPVPVSFLHYSALRVVELHSEQRFSTYALNERTFAQIMFLTGRELARLYVLGYIPDTNWKNKLYIVDQYGSQKVDFIAAPIDIDTLADGEIDLSPYVQILHNAAIRARAAGIPETIVQKAYRNFSNGFLQALDDASTYLLSDDVRLDSAVIASAMQRAKDINRSAIQEQLKAASDENAPIFVRNDYSCYLYSFELVKQLYNSDERAIVPHITDSTFPVIGQRAEYRQQDGSTNVMYEILVQTSAGIQSFFIDTSSSPDELSNQEKGIRLLQTLNEQYLNVALTQSISNIEPSVPSTVSYHPAQIRLEFALFTDENISDIAGLLGNAVAESFVLGLPVPDVLRMFMHIDQTGRPVTIALKNYNGLFENFDQARSPAYIVQPLQQLIAAAHRGGVRSEKIPEMVRNYLVGFETALLNMRLHAIIEHSPFHEKYAVIAADAADALFAQITLSEVDHLILLEHATDIVNNLYALNINGIVMFLTAKSIQIATALSDQGIDSIPAPLAPQDIHIMSHNINRELLLEKVDNPIFSVSLPTVSGDGKTYFVHPLHDNEKGGLVVEALKAFNRPVYPHYAAHIPLFDAADTFVEEKAGDIDLNDFDIDSVYLPEFTRLLGDILAEAYIFGLTDRNLKNIRLTLDSGFPEQMHNVDLAFDQDGAQSIESIMRTFAFVLVSQPTLPKETQHIVAVEFLKSFHNTVSRLQDFYLQHKASLINHQVLSASPEWFDVLQKLDIVHTNPVELITQAAEHLNRLLDLNISLQNDHIAQQPLVASTTKMSAASDELDLVPAELEESPHAERRVDISPASLQELAVQLLKHHAARQILFEADSLTGADVVIGSIQTPVIDDYAVLSFSFTVHIGFQTHHFHVRSAIPDDTELTTRQALQAFELYELMTPHFYADLSYNDFTGFYVQQEPESIPLQQYNDKTLQDYAHVARSLGQALAVADVLRIAPLNASNIMIALNNEQPAATVHRALYSGLRSEPLSSAELLEPFIVFLNKRLDEGHDTTDVFILIQAFLDASERTYSALSSFYRSHERELADQAALNSPPAWTDILNSVNIDKNTIRQRTQSLLDVIDQEFRITIFREAQLTELSMRFARQLQSRGVLTLADTFSEHDIRIGEGNMTSRKLLTGKAALHFELYITDANGIEHSFFVKGLHGKDKSEQTVTALRALNRLPYHVEFFEEQLGAYSKFQVSERVGSMDAYQFNPLHPYRFKFAYYLGSAMAQMQMLGVSDRHLNNFRVVFENNRPTTVYNVDFEDGLMSESDTEFNIANYFITYLTYARQHGVPQEQLLEMAIGFLNGFAFSLNELQREFTRTGSDLQRYPELADLPEWQKALYRLNPETYNIYVLVEEAAELMEKALKLPVLDEINRLVPLNLSNPEEFKEFMGNAGFTHFDAPTQQAIDAEIFTHNGTGIFLKTRPTMPFFILKQMYRRVKVWAENPGLIYKNFVTFILITLTTPSHAIAATRLGSLVPQMKNVVLSAPTTLDEGHRYRGFYFQERVDYTAMELVSTYTEHGAVESVNHIIDLYFEQQIRLWERGAFDVDLLFLNNYGIDIGEPENLKLFDTGGLTDSKALALFLIRSKTGYTHIRDLLRQHLPEACVEYYFARRAEIVTAERLNAVWQTKLGAPADTLQIAWHKLFYEQIPAQAVQQPAPLRTADEELCRFIGEQEFSRYTPPFTGVDMSLYISDNARYFLKRWKTPVRRVIDRIKRFISSPGALNTNMRFLFYNYLSISGVQLAYERLGGLVPPMLLFYRNGSNGTYSFNKTRGAEEVHIQAHAGYLLSELFEKYKTDNNVEAANHLIDQYFEFQLKMWQRGVFDTDLCLWKNYAVADPDNPQLTLIDLSALSDNAVAAMYVFAFKPSFNKIMRKLAEQLPSGSFDYFQQQYDQLFTYDMLQRHWDTQPPQPAERIAFSDHDITIADTADIDPAEQARRDYIQQFVDDRVFVPFKPDVNSLHAQLYANTEKNVFLKITHSNWQAIQTILRHSVNAGQLAVVRDIILFELVSLATHWDQRGEVLAAQRLGNYVPPMYHFSFKSGLNIETDTEPVVVHEGYFQQRVNYTAGQALRMYRDSGDTDRCKQLIDKYIDLQIALWKQGTFDYDMSFYNNYGITNTDTIDLMIFDVGGVSNNFFMAIAYIVYKFKNKPYLEDMRRSVRNLLSEELADYYIEQIQSRLTLKTLFQVWKTDTPVAAEKLHIDVIFDPDLEVPPVSFAQGSSASSNALLQVLDRVTISGNAMQKQNTTIDQERGDFIMGERPEVIDQRLRITQSFLNDIGLGDRIDIAYTLLQLIDACKYYDDPEAAEIIIGSTLTPQSMRRFLAASDTRIYRKMASYMLNLSNYEQQFEAPGLFLVSLYQFITMLSAEPNRAPLRYTPKGLELIEASL